MIRTLQIEIDCKARLCENCQFLFTLLKEDEDENTINKKGENLIFENNIFWGGTHTQSRSLIRQGEYTGKRTKNHVYHLCGLFPSYYGSIVANFTLIYHSDENGRPMRILECRKAVKK
jgi:hypothetical protein